MTNKISIGQIFKHKTDSGFIKVLSNRLIHNNYKVAILGEENVRSIGYLPGGAIEANYVPMTKSEYELEKLLYI